MSLEEEAEEIQADDLSDCCLEKHGAIAVISNWMNEKSLLSKWNRKSVEEIYDSICSQDGEFSIEEYWSIIDEVEQMLSVDFVRLDFGLPGLMPADECLTKHMAMLKPGELPQKYPPYAGIPELRREVASFVSSRLRIECQEKNVFVTCGGTQALFIAQAVVAKLTAGRKRIVLLSPTYPPLISQARFLGLDIVTIEIDSKRGVALVNEVKQIFNEGGVVAICWSSPSNPAWRVLTHQELELIAVLCEDFNVIPIEDLTYFGMHDKGHLDGRTAFPSIAQYTDDYFLVLSASKMLNYAGERIGFLAASSKLLDYESNYLEDAFGTKLMRRVCGSLIFNLTAGAPHSAQYGVAAVLAAINSGTIDLNGTLSTYVKRSRTVKRLLKENGFYLIYSDGYEEDLDGFYICFGYPGVSSIELLRELLYVGITVLPLSVFGSVRSDGVRACIGRLNEEKLILLASRLADCVWRRPCKCLI